MWSIHVPVLACLQALARTNIKLSLVSSVTTFGCNIYSTKKLHTIHREHSWQYLAIGLLPDTQNCGLRMRRECRKRFLRHWLQMKPLVSDPGMHHGTCVTHVPWCMSGSLTPGGAENVPGIPGACATRYFTYLVRGACLDERHWNFREMHSVLNYASPWNFDVIFQCIVEIVSQVITQDVLGLK